MDTGQWKVSRHDIAGIWVALFPKSASNIDADRGRLAPTREGTRARRSICTRITWSGARHTRRACGPRCDLLSPLSFLSAVLMVAIGGAWQIYNIDSGVEQWIDYPRVIKMLEDVGFDGIISLVFELNTVFGQKEAAGVEHLTEEECVPLAVSHLRDCIAGTAPSPPPLGDGPIKWAEPVTEHHLATGFSRL